MNTIDPSDLIEAYGLTNVVFCLQFTVGESVDSHALSLLSSVGLPHSEVFSTKADPQDPYEPGFDPPVVGSRFDHYGLSCPEESRTWWALGYLFTSLIALDPQSGKVYAFPESEEQCILPHRDVEALLLTLIEFRKLEVDHENDVDAAEITERFRKVVGAFDPTPFADEESQWNLSLEEMEHGITTEASGRRPRGRPRRGPSSRRFRFAAVTFDSARRHGPLLRRVARHVRGLRFNRLADYRRPTWPDPAQEKQAHIELGVDDLDVAEKRLLELGAEKPEFRPGEERWQVLLDPAGHPFCITTLV